MRPSGLLLMLGVLASGCGDRHADTATSTRAFNGAPRQLQKSELTAAEQRFGIAPVPDSTVTYQPDVIVVGGGAAAIREQAANGFVWTIAADAPRAGELVPGKVLFMTNRAVGRVLDVRKAGGDLVVTLGPVDITELVDEAHVHITRMAINLDQALSYTAAELPGEFAQQRTEEARALPAYFQAPESSAPDVSPLIAKNFKAFPYASTAGVGLRVTADGGGLKISAESLVHLNRPTLDVHLDISHGKLKEASIELTGAAGLTWTFDAGSDIGRMANVNGMLIPNTDFSIPVGGIGPLPIAVTVRQRFIIKTALGVRNSTLHATGDYTFTGGFRVGYVNKKWGVGGPTSFKAVQSMSRNGQGLSMGVSGLTLGNQMKVIAGVGAFGFAAGPYFSFTSSVGLFRNSDIGMIACNGAVLDVTLSGGVGYLIPQAVTRSINYILRKLNITYQVTGEGGLEPSEPQTIVEKSSQVGGCNVDKDPAAAGQIAGPV